MLPTLAVDATSVPKPCLPERMRAASKVGRSRFPRAQVSIMRPFSFPQVAQRSPHSLAKKGVSGGVNDNHSRIYLGWICRTFRDRVHLFHDLRARRADQGQGDAVEIRRL